MFRGKGLFISFSLCLFILFVSGEISLRTFCSMLCFFVVISAIAVFGRKAYHEIKPYKQAVQACVSRWSSKAITKEQPEKAALVKDLNQLLSSLKKDMDAFVVAWHAEHSNQQYPKLILTSELQSLTKALNHLGKPEDDARLLTEDLRFYQEWATDLQQRFKSFQSFSWQQEKEVIRALASAKRFHSDLGETYPQMPETPEDWAVYGGLTILVNLLCEGTIPAELLLPQMQKLHGELEALMVEQKQDDVSYMLL